MKKKRGRPATGRADRIEQLARDRINRRKRVESSPKKCVQFLLTNIRGRCKSKNIPCTITVDDFDVFPTHCPDLKEELIYGNKGKASPWSAAVDKIIPELGYVPGNVRIVSYKANVMKQNATLDEMYTIAESWMKLYHNSAFIENQTATQTVLNGVQDDVQ